MEKSQSHNTKNISVEKNKHNIDNTLKASAKDKFEK